jgi:hypothetical protein
MMIGNCFQGKGWDGSLSAIAIALAFGTPTRNTEPIATVDDDNDSFFTKNGRINLTY